MSALPAMVANGPPGHSPDLKIGLAEPANGSSIPKIQ
jgi:hypothetical protein